MRESTSLSVLTYPLQYTSWRRDGVLFGTQISWIGTRSIHLRDKIFRSKYEYYIISVARAAFRVRKKPFAKEKKRVSTSSDADQPFHLSLSTSSVFTLRATEREMRSSQFLIFERSLTSRHEKCTLFFWMINYRFLFYLFSHLNFLDYFFLLLHRVVSI